VQHSVVYALGVAVSPIPIAAILLILSSRGASANAMSFAAGWIAGLTTSALVFTVLVNGLDVTDSAPVWISVADLILGVAFLAVAARVWFWWRPLRSSPAWLDVVDRFTPVRSAIFGGVLSGANPKVLALSLGAAISVARARTDTWVTVAAVALFVAIGATGVLVPIAAYIACPTQGGARLASLRRWLARHERVVLAVLSLAIGGFFLQDGIDSLQS
jgi:Sap, sulfolipid-1-addressing protein